MASLRPATLLLLALYVELSHLHGTYPAVSANSESRSPSLIVAKNGAQPIICPTVTSTAHVCSSCVQPACLALSTLSNPSACPPKIATVTVSYPCKDGVCPYGCMSTSYITGGETMAEESCPTVTTTTASCHTCVQLECLELSTIKQMCNCPTQVPTVSIGFNCDEPCPGGCGATEYVYDSIKPNCEGYTAPKTYPPAVKATQAV